MAYIKTGRPAGRPKQHAPGAEPRSIGLRLPRELYARLERAATTRQTSLTALVVQALERSLDGHLDVIDNALTATTKALGHLEAALSPDDPRMAHIDAIYQSLSPIDETLNLVLKKDITHEHHA